jgi:hypothetical protein
MCVREVRRRLKKKFSIKNTTGYHMAAFIDASTPLEIFRRLLVGSEGTIASISEAVFETVPDDQYRLSAFFVFPDMHSARAAVAPFVAHGAAAVELSDRGCLRAVEGKPGVPDRRKTLPNEATALLVEFRESSPEKLVEAERAAQSVPEARVPKGLPPRPQLDCLVHDAPPPLAPLCGLSQPNRMPWGASWRVKILETTVYRVEKLGIPRQP